MKRTLLMSLILCLLCSLSACEQKNADPFAVTIEAMSPVVSIAPSESPVIPSETEAFSCREMPIDVDLTRLSSTMVFGEVFNMITKPMEYQGKIVKMDGEFIAYESPENGVTYFTVLVADAMGCCQQGIEFILEDSYQYPADYPTPGDQVTVIGAFETYYENEVPYHRLKNAYIPV